MNKTIVLTLDLETLPPHFKAHIGRDSKTTEILLKENLTNLKCTLRSSTKLFYLFHHFVKFWWKLQIKMIFKKCSEIHSMMGRRQKYYSIEWKLSQVFDEMMNERVLCCAC